MRIHLASVGMLLCVFLLSSASLAGPNSEFKPVHVAALDPQVLEALVRTTCSYPRNTHANVLFAAGAHLPMVPYTKYFGTENRLKQFGVVEGDCRLLDVRGSVVRFLIGSLDPNPEFKYYAVVSTAGDILNIRTGNPPNYRDGSALTSFVIANLPGQIAFWADGMPRFVENTRSELNHSAPNIR